MSDPVNDPFFASLCLPPFTQRYYEHHLDDFSYPSQGDFTAAYNRQARLAAASTSNTLTRRWMKLPPGLEIFTFEIHGGGYRSFDGAPQLYKTATLSGDLKSDSGEVNVYAGTDTISYAPSPTTGILVYTHSYGEGLDYGIGEVMSATVRTITAPGINNGITITLSNPLTMDDLIGWAATARYDVDYQHSNHDGRYEFYASSYAYAVQSPAALDGTEGMFYIRSRYRLGPVGSNSYTLDDNVPLAYKSAMRWDEVTRQINSDVMVDSITYSALLAKPYFDRWGAFHPNDLQWADAGWQASQKNGYGNILATDGTTGIPGACILGTRLKVRSLTGTSVRLTLTTAYEYYTVESPPEVSTEIIVLPLVAGITAFHESLLPDVDAGQVVYTQLTLVEILDAVSQLIPETEFHVIYARRSVDKIAGFLDWTDTTLNTARLPRRYAKCTRIQRMGSTARTGDDTRVDEYSEVTGDLLPQVVTSHPSASTSHKAQTVEFGGQTDWHELVPAGAGTSTGVEFAIAYRIGDRVGGTSGDAGGIGGTSGAAGGSSVSAEDQARTVGTAAANAASAKSGDIGYRPDGSSSASGTMGHQSDGSSSASGTMGNTNGGI